MEDVPLMYCEFCNRPYTWKKNKYYCREQCKSAARERRKSIKDKELAALPVLEMPDEIPADMPVGEYDDTEQSKAKYAITRSAPKGATGYRLGCMNLHNTVQHQQMRWFPPAHARWPAVFSIDPFAHPSVPFPVTYVIAYFDIRDRLMGNPELRLKIKTPVALIPWSKGDRNMELDRRGIVNITRHPI